MTTQNKFAISISVIINAETFRDCEKFREMLYENIYELEGVVDIGEIDIEQIEL